ncbi:MAG: hypothetical protein Tsb002_30150 [Wenzhouxiangellaceae bacterium]
MAVSINKEDGVFWGRKMTDLNRPINTKPDNSNPEKKLTLPQIERQRQSDEQTIPITNQLSPLLLSWLISAA